MRLSSSSVSLLFLAATAASAQTSGAPQQAAAPATAPYTLKAGTNRVLVDVVVQDKKGNLIHGLKQSDFTVLENKQPQAIKSFDEHVSATTTEVAAAQAIPSLPAGQFTNFVPVKQSSAVTVLLFDRLNTGLRDQSYVRSQLVDYLKHALPDARIAIYGLTDHLILLQGFSSNPAVLLHALEDKGLTKASPLRDDVNGGNNGVEDLSAAITTVNATGSSSAGIAAFEAQYQSFQAQIQGKYTLDALNQLARSLAIVPGRKNLVWFTGNFPTGFFPGDNDPNVPYGQFAGLEREFQETIDLLTSSQVAIYPVDAQGLRTNSNNNAGLRNEGFGTIHVQQSSRGLGAANAIESEDAAIGREHLGEEQLAHDTGGQAFYNANDLNRAVDEALTAGSNYYTLAYTPANAEDKTTFRRISVNIAGQNYKLSYRRGYYAGVPATPTTERRQIAGAAADAPAPSTAMRGALLRGGPEPTEILLRVKAGPIDLGGDAQTVQGNALNPGPKKSKGPYQAFQVDYATSIRAIGIRKTADSLFHSDLDFVAYVYDARGALVNMQSNTFRGTFTAKELADTLRAGLPFTQRISVPQAGEYFLRLAVHDNINDKVGAVEIPVAQIRSLPLPVASAGSVPARATP